MSRFTGLVTVPVSGKGTALADKAFLMPGVTQGTDLGLAIPSDAAGVDTIGRLLGVTATANDSAQTGVTWSYREVELMDSIQLETFEYDQATAALLAVTSFSGTTVTITSLENNADCGWIYVVAGSGIGQLLFCTAINGGTATIKTAPATALDSTSKIIRIHRFGHKLVTLNTAGDKIKTQAAAGSRTVFNWENYVDSPQGGISRQLLDPTKHDNLVLSKARFFSRMSIRTNAGR